MSLQATSMKGGGYYDRNSSIQASTNATAIPLIQKAIEEMDMPAAGQAFTLVDYGSSEGKNSAEAVASAISSLQKIRGDEPISIVHNDLFTNDFNRLFYNIYQNPEASYLFRSAPSSSDSSAISGQRQKNVFVTASGTSFYEQVMPSSTVHLGISAWAAQWLSQSPAIRMNHIYYAGAEGENRQRFAEQAAKDWLQFLTMRTNELVSGGKFVMTLPSQVSDPNALLEQVRSTPETMNNKLQEMVAEGLIDRDVYENFIFPYYFRTLDEALEPLISKTSPLSQKVSLDSSLVQAIPCPMFAEYLRTKDKAVYANAYVSWLRAWSEPILAKGIFSRSASSESDAFRMIDDFYGRIQETVEADPLAHIFKVEACFLVFTKK
jgi:hypothetical protein